MLFILLIFDLSLNIQIGGYRFVPDATPGKAIIFCRPESSMNGISFFPVFMPGRSPRRPFLQRDVYIKDGISINTIGCLQYLFSFCIVNERCTNTMPVLPGTCFNFTNITDAGHPYSKARTHWLINFPPGVTIGSCNLIKIWRHRPGRG